MLIIPNFNDRTATFKISLLRFNLVKRHSGYIILTLSRKNVFIAIHQGFKTKRLVQVALRLGKGIFLQRLDPLGVILLLKLRKHFLFGLYHVKNSGLLDFNTFIDDWSLVGDGRWTDNFDINISCFELLSEESDIRMFVQIYVELIYFFRRHRFLVLRSTTATSLSIDR